MYPIPKLPVPTDNICKFYALTGIILFVTSITLIVLLSTRTNDIIFETVTQEIEAEKLEEGEERKIRLEMAETLRDIAVKDRDTGSGVLTFFATLGFVVAAYGLLKWHLEIQPLYDQILKFERDKIKIDRAMAYHEYKEALKASANKSE
jgi:hypothetical protein